jgi:predicted phosphoadenosine phosphosulfate sulfurtransferase
MDVDVLAAARDRISWAMDRCPRAVVSFSAGKDSTVLMHLVAEEARRRGTRVGCLFIDWEAQFTATIEHARSMMEEYADCIDPYWIALPLLTTNACSQIEPEWTCWDPAKRDLWVRDLPPEAVAAEDLPFYRFNMTFEEFVPEFSEWYAGGQECACFVGIRTQESLNRWRAVTSEDGIRLDGVKWTTHVRGGAYNIYPIYDWTTEDIWTFHGKKGLPYNRLYDLMHKAGLSVSQMRICEPYGDEQRRGLWLYHILEPELWARVAFRVAGANTGALYSRERGSVMGNGKISLPPGMTWKSYAEFLLDTMPAATAEHYKNKITVWLRWYQKHGFPDLNIPDFVDNDCGAKDTPSWRRVCKMLLKNDYWCKTLCFSPTKTDGYERYQKLMERRRGEWGIFSETDAPKTLRHA